MASEFEIYNTRVLRVREFQIQICVWRLRTITKTLDRIMGLRDKFRKMRIMTQSQTGPKLTNSRVACGESKSENRQLLPIRQPELSLWMKMAMECFHDGREEEREEENGRSEGARRKGKEARSRRDLGSNVRRWYCEVQVDGCIRPHGIPNPGSKFDNQT
ncbi:hypothetical protein Droror1_Dr00017179 [Drosera rotundifolia]